MYYKFDNTELFDGVTRPDFRSFDNNLVIYGAGLQGLLTAHLLKQQGIKVLCFGDRAENKQNTTYYGLPVYSPEEMAHRYPDAAAIVTPYTLQSAYEYVRDELGYGERTFTPFSLFLEFDSAGFDDLPELPDWYHPESLGYTIAVFMRKCVNVETTHSLLSAFVFVTEACNLRCKNCLYLIPCYQKPQHYDYDIVLRDLTTLLKGRKFQHIFLVGGETLLWKPLPRLIRALCEASEVMECHVVTNGTVFPGPELLEALQHPKAAVRISDYGALSKKDRLIPLLQENHIRYWVQLQRWYELSTFRKKPLSGDAYERVINACCHLGGRGNKYLVDGKLFHCASQAHLHQLGIYRSDEKDYVNLRDEDQEYVQRRITEFMDVKHMPPAPGLCRHCDGRGYTGVEVPPAQQLAPGEKIRVRFE